MHSIRHAQGRPESEQLRPIYRKGFPGKKSARAEVSNTITFIDFC